MLIKTIIAAGALLSMAAAVPMQQQNKRDVVWETRTTWDYTTVHVTTTVWLAPGETAPTGSAAPAAATHFGHKHKHPKPSPKQPSQPPVASSPPAQSPSSPYSPPPASTPSPAPASSPAPVSSPKPQPSSGPSGGNYPSNGLTGDAAPGTKYTGDFTWYQTGLGACGITSSPSDHIVAVSEDLFDLYTPSSGNPNDNPLCGKTVDLTGVDGTTYPAKIVDRCTGCALSDLDLSQDFFNLVTSYGNGRVSGMSWVFA